MPDGRPVGSAIPLRVVVGAVVVCVVPVDDVEVLLVPPVATSTTMTASTSTRTTAATAIHSSVDLHFPRSLRIYGADEIERLGYEGVACLRFLEDAGALTPELREIVIDRALAASDGPLGLDDLKVIVMMVYWRAGVSPGVLVLDELTDDARARLPH